MDTKPSVQWVILELNPKADGEDPEIIRRSLRHMIRNAEVFVPAKITEKGRDRVVQYLVDGYAFIRRDFPDAHYFRLEGSRYVQSIITHPATDLAPRRVACITTADIEKMRQQIQVETDQGIDVGDTILITSGVYKQLQAEVIEDIPEMNSVQVVVKFRSKEALITLPRSFLEFVSKRQRPPFADRTERLRAWVDGAVQLVGWSQQIEPLHQKHRNLARFQNWRHKGGDLCSHIMAVEAPNADLTPLVQSHRRFLKINNWVRRRSRPNALVVACETPLDVQPLVELSTHLTRTHTWCVEGKTLTSFLAATVPNVAPIEAKYLEWEWLTGMLGRLTQVYKDVDAIDRVCTVEEDGVDKVQNIVVDGHNLAFRCLYAPGMTALTDSHGRPTGIILGFLRSLGALAKRFPEASLYVTWDGSSQRRKRMFPDYKATRAHHATPEFDQIGWLREALPLLGVAQAFHPEEEADDVIASLVRTTLRGQCNVILTTDRDLLQLVTDRDEVLVPVVGGRKEIRFDPAAVEAEYGVPPCQMPVLRAFLGDTSDNIPGVPRLPVKVAAGLVRTYGGSIQKIYDSGLAEVTKFQYAKLREAEAQVRLNADLMRLDIGIAFSTADPARDMPAVQQRLQEVAIQPDPILAAFFPQSS